MIWTKSDEILSTEIPGNLLSVVAAEAVLAHSQGAISRTTAVGNMICCNVVDLSARFMKSCRCQHWRRCLQWSKLCWFLTVDSNRCVSVVQSIGTRTVSAAFLRAMLWLSLIATIFL